MGGREMDSSGSGKEQVGGILV